MFCLIDGGTRCTRELSGNIKSRACRDPYDVVGNAQGGAIGSIGYNENPMDMVSTIYKGFANELWS